MSDDPLPQPPEDDRVGAEPAGSRLSFKAGGWVLLLSAVMMLLMLARYAPVLIEQSHRKVIGNPEDVTSYGFDFDHCPGIDCGAIVSSGLPRDPVPVMDDPPMLNAEEVERITREERGKYLVSHDRVIAAIVDGQPVVWPLAILQWHEVVNQRIAGRPIGVVYHPLSGVAAVFDRRLGEHEVLLGVSGLLHNSIALLYDRNEQTVDRGMSLWDPLVGAAVSGPQAEQGAQLARIDAQLVQWVQWIGRHPQTIVLGKPPQYYDRYKRSAYGIYEGNDLLRYPVTPLPNDDIPRKTPVLALRLDGDWRVWNLDELARRAAPDGRWSTDFNGQRLDFLVGTKPSTAWLRIPEGMGDRMEIVHAMWFAFHAHYPQVKLLP